MRATRRQSASRQLIFQLGLGQRIVNIVALRTSPGERDFCAHKPQLPGFQDCHADMPTRLAGPDLAAAAPILANAQAD